jgi:hypothetical protein
MGDPTGLSEDIEDQLQSHCGNEQTEKALLITLRSGGFCSPWKLAANRQRIP